MNTDLKTRAPLTRSTYPDSGFWGAFGRHWQTSMRYYGLRHTLAQVIEAAYRFCLEFLPERRRAKFGDLDYDFEHEVNTTRSNVSFRSQLIAALSAHQYFPSEPWLFEQIMDALASGIQQSALSIQSSGSCEGISACARLKDFTFIDLGSGKGRALLMAVPYGFKRIIGVEFMLEWHQTAEANIRKFAESHHGCPPMESLCMDARDFEFPEEPTVVYLFNPFPEPVLARVLERLRESLRRKPRPVFVAYRYLEFEKLLQQCDWLEKIAGTEQWAVYGFIL